MFFYDEKIMPILKKVLKLIFKFIKFIKMSDNIFGKKCQFIKNVKKFIFKKKIIS